MIAAMTPLEPATAPQMAAAASPARHVGTAAPRRIRASDDCMWAPEGNVQYSLLVRERYHKLLDGPNSPSGNVGRFRISSGQIVGDDAADLGKDSAAATVPGRAVIACCGHAGARGAAAAP